MKLIYCPDCNDVRALSKEPVSCRCGHACGVYINVIDAEISGTAISLGFGNSSFSHALINQPEDGAGKEFLAFVIPKSCKTIRRKQWEDSLGS